MQEARDPKTILVVDDEPEVRKLVAAMIAGLGHTVLTADSGEHALALYDKLGTRIDLLVTDVVAPGMSGPVLANRLLARQPDLKVLFISGYDHSHVVQSYVLNRGCTLLSKPFGAHQLRSLVHELLADARQSRAAGSGAAAFGNIDVK
jgi:two-component system cell cycle sensor histidine kinase/response regulator CckA